MTVPFITRYRKEATQRHDDAQPRDVKLRLEYLREREDRRAVVTRSVADQGKLTPALAAALAAAATKLEFKDLYAPY